MKGKIAFVLGAAVGYVLGSRAGRERYEQIKRGAQKVWNTEPVQKGVGLVRDAAQTRVDEAKAVVVRAGKGAVAAFLNDSGRGAPRASGGDPRSGTSGAAPKSSASADTPKTAGVDTPDGDAEGGASSSGGGAA
ncbi:YtxH domain-containing protein [Leucobacter triazinivorans]|uniref:YtxH domain-containing protein n=1 Tax=Leucobacter triazinivorans TaxID=1784719 RepID=UPI001F0F2632|nr:YtxH domain-containing protein [Leucobacter triazinivorans]